ncbi:hypothetical protein [Alicyclobacillus sp.]|uniref:hypothetical protein n=1 Tax=Alicyclobacillus sp. TaxID=61169 RepID=UPI0025C1FB1E|nr:hypothetical protein [Alicyclobacillus sp.]MCL6518055.1 hypothetical protein [Alicyclobacillus sp.]
MDHLDGQPQKPKGSAGSSWALFGIPLAAVVCCGLPVLLTALGFTAAGAFLELNRFFVLGGMVLLMGAVMFIASRKAKGCGLGSCNLPNRNQASNASQEDR